jgi:hypothetical protein
MREFKFRVWDIGMQKYSKMPYYNIGENGHLYYGNAKDDDVLEQYTGIKDSNDNEIYEGDILITDTGAICEVIFDEQFVTFDIKTSRRLDYKDFIKGDCKVIGNIHENEELLKSL